MGYVSGDGSCERVGVEVQEAYLVQEAYFGGEVAVEPVLGGREDEELGAVEEGGGEGTCEGVVVEGEGEEGGESS